MTEYLLLIIFFCFLRISIIIIYKFESNLNLLSNNILVDRYEETKKLSKLYLILRVK